MRDSYSVELNNPRALIRTNVRDYLTFSNQLGCGEDQVQGNLTKTSTFEVTVGEVSGTNSAPVIQQTFSEQTRESGACTPRKCQAGQFQCKQDLGGNCCPFGNKCLTGGFCGVGVTPPPSSAVPTANGCPSKNMFACASDLGGACCTNGQTCVVTNGVQGCAGQPTSPPGTEITYNGGGLSQGAKAGIGVGVAVAAAVIIGFVTWFCLRQRRQARRSSAYRSQQQQQQQQHRGYQSVNGQQAGGLGIGGTTEAMSQVSDQRSRTGGPHRTGLVYEYFGPDAVAGPYTQQEEDELWPDAQQPPRRHVGPVRAAKTTPTPSVAPQPAGVAGQQADVYELWGSPGDTLERSPLEEAGERHLPPTGQERPYSHISSNTEYRNSQENPDPHSTAESGSTAAESAQEGGGAAHGNGSSAATAAAAESAHGEQGHRTEPDDNHQSTQV
ncbi:uncharacterized protein PG998_000293 [Apiospora kogelbergensis]|uniref:uncharacterized protein n=1 Tax=Apiospora kogelbergensis TaxID=1337665 RepID=UPI0031322612